MTIDVFFVAVIIDVFFLAVIVFLVCLALVVVIAGMAHLFGWKRLAAFLAAAGAMTVLVMWLSRGALGIH